MSSAYPVYVVRGSDPVLLNEALGRLTDELLGDRSPGIALEDVSEEATIAAVLDICQTPALLTDRRVVVVRNAGRFRADEIEPLVHYLGGPMTSTSLVLVAGGGVLSTRLLKAVKELGHVIDASPPAGKGRQTWLAGRLRTGPVQLDAGATAMVSDYLGEDLGRLEGLLDALAAAYGQGARVGAGDIEPFVGTRGVGAPWALTDAIDAGDTAGALEQLHRLLDGGQRHPLVVISILSRHVSALLRLDGGPATSDSAAAELLGTALYPAKKALAQTKKLGTSAIARAVDLVANADIDLRGRSSWSAELIVEVLVARLSRLAPSRSQSGPSKSRSRPSGS